MKATNDPFFDAVMNAAATRTNGMATRLSGFAAERKDVYQELVLDMLEHKKHFDPAKGSAGTFTGMVSKHRASELLDSLIKDRQRLCFGYGLKASNDPDSEEYILNESDNVVPIWGADLDLFADSDALHDLEIALAFMTDEQAALFQLLEAHQDLPSAAKACGMSSATFYRRVADLQMHLRMFGFKSAA